MSLNVENKEIHLEVFVVWDVDPEDDDQFSEPMTDAAWAGFKL